jgi:hypothetical protein
VEGKTRRPCCRKKFIAGLPTATANRVFGVEKRTEIVDVPSRQTFIIGAGGGEWTQVNVQRFRRALLELCANVRRNQPGVADWINR